MNVHRHGRATLALLMLALAGGFGTAEAADPAPPAAQESPDGLQPKRVAPPAVEPVVIGKLRFEPLPWGRERGLGQNGGYIAAYDDASGAELWILKVYHISYDPSLEEDVQDVFIASMSKTLFGGKLRITDEKGRRYTVDPDTRTVETD